jgi:hypothetical protein
MPNKLLLGLAITLALVVGLYHYNVRQVEKHLNVVAAQLAPIGMLEHRKVSFSLSGEVRIDRLRFQPHAVRGDITVDRLAIRTGSLGALLRLRSDLDHGTLPRQLGLSARGVRIPVDGGIFAAMAESANLGLIFDAAGCGRRDYFSGRDLGEMGYWDLIGDVDLDYRVEGDVDSIVLSVAAEVQGMNRFSFESRVDMVAPSRHYRDLGMGMNSSALQSMEFNYEDRGYYPRMLAYCAGEMDLRMDDYLAHHLEAWQARWLDMGMVPGPITVESYGRFINEPGRLKLNILPFSDLSRLLMQGAEPARLLSQVDLLLFMDGEKLGTLDVRPATQDELRSAPSMRRSQISADEAGESAPVRGLQPVETGSLARHVGASVVIVLEDGRRWAGVLQSAEDESIQLQRRMSGGYVIVPVRRADIAEVYVDH